jgi:two-component system, chemotaxis family, protein-glutamate methylesterase/glutaminase
MKPIRVLVVDDSPSMRLMLNHVLALDPRIQVLATVNDGQAAVEFLAASIAKPDVVLMDIHMPRLDGFEATRRIMERHPLPIVICTATADPREMEVAFRSMEAGAVACVEKPVSYQDPRFDTCVQNLQQTVWLMAEVKVVRRWPKPRIAGTRAVPAVTTVATPCGTPRMVGIGASTGGPLVLQTILSGLPKDFSASLLIVQHIARGFLPGMVEWLNQTTGLHVHVAAHGAQTIPGHAYIAPDDFHLGVSSGGRLQLARDAPDNGLRPSVSWLFRSLADNLGASAIGVLLTGMGRDGADELRRMRERGAFTIAQDRESSVVHGMPGAAIEIGAAMHVLPADRIAVALITELTRRIPQAGGAES